MLKDHPLPTEPLRMKTLRLPTLLAVPFLLALAPSADELSFHPAKDAKSKKTLAIEVELNVKDASFSVNGDPMPAEALDQIKSQALLLDLSVGATETFLASRDGRPVDLVRTYDDLKASVEMGDNQQTLDEVKEFEGKSVRFTWNDKEKAYDKVWHESKGEDAALEDLIDDMEVRALLPDRKVSSGDTWDVPAKDLEPLFLPGGMLSPKGKDDAGEFDEIAEGVGKQLEDAFKDFKVVCTYKGAREEGGVRVAEVTFRYDGKARVDLAPILQKIQEKEGGEGMPEMHFTANCGLDLKGEGTLLWDLGTGTLHSYTMNADVGLDVSVEMSGEQEGQSIEVSMSGSIGGTVGWTMKRE
jgi:hypothetical protein